MIIKANKYQKHRSNRRILTSICISKFSLSNFSQWTNSFFYYFLFVCYFSHYSWTFFRRHLELHKNTKLWRATDEQKENCLPGFAIKLNKVFTLICYFHKAKPKEYKLNE